MWRFFLLSLIVAAIQYPNISRLTATMYSYLGNIGNVDVGNVVLRKLSHSLANGIVYRLAWNI